MSIHSTHGVGSDDFKGNLPILPDSASSRAKEVINNLSQGIKPTDVDDDMDVDEVDDNPDVEDQTDVEDDTGSDQDQAQDIAVRHRGSLRRLESSSNTNNDFNYGQINSEQWHLVRDFRKGDLSEDDLKTQFVSLEKQKLDPLVTSGKITQDEEDSTIAKFSSLLDKLISNWKVK